MIKEIFIKNKDNIFVYDAINNKNYTYYDIYNISMTFKKLFSYIRNKNIIFYLDNSIEYISLYFWAFFSSNNIYPLNKKLTIKEVKNIANEYNAKYIITDINHSFDSLKSINIKNINTDNIANYNLRDFPNIEYNRKFLYMYSSGTTGMPKCIAHSLNAFLKNGKKFIDFHELNNEVFYMLLDLSYMAGFYNMFFLSFITSSKLVLKKSFLPQDILFFWNYIIKYKVSIIWLIPTVIKLLINLDRSEKGKEYILNIKKIFSCTAPLNLNDKVQFRKKYNTKLFNTYGLSEVLFISSENDFYYKEEVGCVGKPLENILINNGEVCIKDSVFEGYKDFKDNNLFFYTGDLGIIKNDILYILGRSKDIIIKGGVNISPIFMEEKIKKLNFVYDVSIFGIDDTVLGEKIICAIVLKDKTKISELKQYCKEIFATDKQIDDFMILDALPLNNSNKVDKLKLKKIYKEL